MLSFAKNEIQVNERKNQNANKQQKQTQEQALNVAYKVRKRACLFMQRL